MLIGILVWITTIGGMDVEFETASLSRFSSSPRKVHLTQALRVLGI